MFLHVSGHTSDDTVTTEVSFYFSIMKPQHTSQLSLIIWLMF